MILQSLVFVEGLLMTWKFSYVSGLKAQLALPSMSFTKHCQGRLIDTIRGQVSLIYEARNLRSKSYKAVNKRIDCKCTVCVSMQEGLFRFCNRRDVKSLFGIHLLYIWLAMTPHRRPGSNKVQSLTALAHQGRHGYSGTITQTHKQMDSLSRIQTVSLTDKFKISRQTEKSSPFD